MCNTWKALTACLYAVILVALTSCYQSSPVRPLAVTPTSIKLQGSEVAISVGDARLVVDAAIGGRVTEFSYADKNVLVKAHESDLFGSTFWTSPKADWNKQFVKILQADPYEIRVDGVRAELASMLDPKTGLQVKKSFAPSVSKDGFEITYSVYNHSQKAIMIAPWEVSRFHGGVTYFPSNGKSLMNNLALEENEGMTWYQHAPEGLSEAEMGQLKFDGVDGWVANANPETGLLFVKRFPNILEEHLAPGAGELEISAAKNDAHLILANQGAYQAIAPGKSISWRVNWYIAPLLTEDVTSTNKILVEQAQTIVSFDGKL